jgi:hypothetical protein
VATQEREWDLRKGTFLSGLLLGFLAIGIFLSTSPCLVANSWAWSNGGYSSDPADPDYGTHDWIAEHALDWLPAEEKQYMLGNLAAYLYGTELPDNGGAPDGIGDSLINHHIYYDSAESMTDDAAAVRASTEYNDTLAYLKANDYANASKNAGIMTHYIADMAVFGHVMGASTDWGNETHHSDYENYVNVRTSNYTAEFNSFLSFDGNLDAISAYEAAKKLAYDTTFDVDGPLNCTWMDQNYDWNNPTFKNRAGESLNLAVNYVADVLHALYLEANMPGEHYLLVPHYYQTKGYYCGPAALEMVFDYYGPDIPQTEIADVARTAPAPYGTYTPDMVRAAHFSNLSTSVGAEMPGSITGYTARTFGYVALEHRFTTMVELKSLIAAGYPIIVLTTWHFRVAVGYNSTHFTFQDSAYGENYNMTYAYFDTDWDYSSHWALLVTPWRIEVSAPPSILQGSAFNVTASITYPAPYPFYTNQYPATLSNATISHPSGLNLAPDETSRKVIHAGTFSSGDSATVNWTVTAKEAGTHTIRVEALGKVAGSVPSLPTYPQPYSYTDRIGGFNEATAEVLPEEIPPITVDNYDGSWHTTDFTITLTATDSISGVAETYYKLNNNPTQTVTADGQPLITTEAANNKLEYWSIDNAGNEESHHILTEIKLDKTAPTGSITINNGDTYTTSNYVTLESTAEDTTSGAYQVRYSNDGVWDTELWEAPSTTKTWTLPTGDGTKTVYYQIKGNAGLISLTYSDTITLDTLPPAVSITDPTSGYESKSSTLTITWSGSDETSGISHYEIRLDGEPRNNVETDTTCTLTDLAEGTHTFYVKATDSAGNEIQDTITFVVNTSPLLGPVYLEEAAIAAALVIVALGIVAYVMRKRRKR